MEMVMRSRKPAILCDVYCILTFSIYKHFSLEFTYAGLSLMKKGKGNRKTVLDVGMGMILVSLLVFLLGQWGS